MRIRYVKSDGAESSSLNVHDTDNGGCPGGNAGPGAIAQLGRGYERPQVLVIGDVRTITAGSTSSGNKDANSQYYW